MFLETFWGKRWRHRHWIGLLVVLLAKNTPPIPSPEASQAPTTLGVVGASSAILVGLVVI